MLVRGSAEALAGYLAKLGEVQNGGIDHGDTARQSSVRHSRNDANGTSERLLLLRLLFPASVTARSWATTVLIEIGQPNKNSANEGAPYLHSDSFRARHTALQFRSVNSATPHLASVSTARPAGKTAATIAAARCGPKCGQGPVHDLRWLCDGACARQAAGPQWVRHVRPLVLTDFLMKWKAYE